MDAESLLEDNRFEQRENARAALRAASRAVAKARDAVVDAAKRYAENEPRGLHVLDAVELLWAAESAEAEVRARLEALR